MAPKKQPTAAALGEKSNSNSNNKQATLSDKYKKLDHKEHVLTRPGMYIGSIDEDTFNTWVFDAATERLVKRDIRYIPGLYKIFDEIVVNAVDHGVRLKLQGDEHQTKNIRVNIDKETGWIEVTNDGEGIEVELHPEHNIYIPQLIFGTMLTSTNYSDDDGSGGGEERIIGGQNGIGAKACNIFSKEFHIETVDAKRKKIYHQAFSDNMSIAHPPQVKSCTKKPYTTIRFLPDYARFRCSGLSDDMYAMFVKRVYDVCALTESDVHVHLNGKKLEFKTFEKYVDMYIGGKDDHARAYEKVNDRLEVVATYHDGGEALGMEHVSFVNGIWTLRGGKHVEHVATQLANRLCELAAKRRKDSNIKPQHIKNYLFVFVKSTIPNPTFDSQSKDVLTTPATKFGFKVEFTDKFVDKLYKSGIIEKAISISELNAEKTLKKTDGKKRSTIYGIPKLDDANWAGTARSRECTLILTEGDSAKSMAIAGIGEVGRDRYGVFPLRGKLLNVKDVGITKLTANEEITNLKKILGLESNRSYTCTDDLRYGKIMIMTDQDHDGSHIKGLLINMFQTLWPSLVHKDNFITSMLTPIIKLRKGNEVHEFYSVTEFEQWKARHGGDDAALRGWTPKYYKGLGTSTSAEAKDYFKQLKVVSYKWNAESSDQHLDLAFNKKRADDRKEWLSNYDPQRILDYSKREVSYEEFVNSDLIHFSKYDLERSIPSVCDGLKVSQRKVLYACFKRNLTKQEIRVAQLAAYVSEHSAYHHGEASLQGTIIGLAQNFVGSNNINMLRPNGQFGTRIQGGKDAASPRYIHTVLEDVVRLLFRKQDEKVLKYLDDDGFPIEPEHYVPILPMVLVNGAIGIGTGFSTNVPCYNPLDIVAALKAMLTSADPTELPELVPWYHGFKGTIETMSDGKFVSRGCYTRTAPTKVQITELPIGMWTEDFKMQLEEMLEKNSNVLKSFDNQYTDQDVAFTLVFANKQVLDDYLQVQPNGFTKLENELKLCSTRMLSTTNMYLFNSSGQITKYDKVGDILRDFYSVRLKTYTVRKQALIDELESELVYISAKVRFILEIITEQIDVRNTPKDALVATLTQREYPKMEDTYDYLLRMPIYSLTRERKEELEREEASMRHELEVIRGTSETTMWLNELEEFEAVYRKLNTFNILNFRKN